VNDAGGYFVPKTKLGQWKTKLGQAPRN
jgi:hypothetical protein